MLDLITPVILTYNEAPNIERSLERLRWAKDVVIVDSHSSDETLAIAGQFPNVRVLERRFDSHEGQWSFALTQTGIETEWVLRLDADYILTQELIDEIAKLKPSEAVAGYRIAFTYCVFGRPLRASLYPPNSILFRRQRVSCRQDGHTERWDVEGEVLPLEGRALHDDRKSVGRWVLAQARYLARERDKLVTADPASLDLPDRIRRRRWLAPWAMLFHCLIVKRLIFDGWLGIFYSFQRTAVELILSLFLMEHEAKSRQGAEGGKKVASYILGINAYHGDSSACLLKDGALVAAAEEERFRRVKHWAGFPSEAIGYCLEAAGVTLGEVDHVAINRDPKANFWRKLGYTLVKRPKPSLVLSRLRNRQQWGKLGDELRAAFPGQRFGGRIHHVEHHVAHLASAYLVSPFERAVVVSVDGFGDFASAAWGLGSGSKVSVEGRVLFPHSLGIFYQAMTQYLGFPHYGDEYKVMGLAPYGNPIYLEQMRRVVRLRDDGTFRLGLEFFRHHVEHVDYEWNDGAPTVGPLFTSALDDLLGPRRQEGEPLEQRHKDLARSIQAMFEAAVFHLLNHLHRRYGGDAVAIAGGCGFNSVANGRIRANTPFKRIYIQSAAGDAGGAIGSACAVWHQGRGERQRFLMDHAYWGPEFSDQHYADLLRQEDQALRANACKTQEHASEQELCRVVAQAIADGKVVGWFQGRMEWGPRALGNRSILCDPRRADMKEILNQKIKRRESFRPFAPSVLRDAVGDWFEQDDDVPFMMKVFQIREAKRAQVPAVAHVDGSGRLQTVTRETNPRYHRLIEAFRALTGVPMVLNTSFNENEPVVCRPEEAIDCFLRTKMDVLVLGSHMVERTGPGLGDASDSGSVAAAI